ncbi:hypothetical protein AAG570_010470 [Ranatra chinensis]|uniref:Uncharacterized protein n=1 Tax=Ranatra chinensis TaxID=642074 RepID=A0ABD0YMM3_9HEMI
MKLKIIMIGPCQAGKTTIANFLSEAVEYPNEDYHPTKGVRIIEFKVKNSFTEAEIELWDCSGNQKDENVWSVFLWKAHGILLVYNPEDADNLQELDVFYNQFISDCMILNNCLIVAHYKDLKANHTPPELGESLSNVPCITANVFENGEDLRTSFEQFISSIFVDVKDVEGKHLNVSEQVNEEESP